MESSWDLTSVFDGQSERAPRVLLAEDNEANLLVAQGALALFKCEVVTVRNGFEAALAARRQAFDLILMDCEMPLLDGLDAARHIRIAEAKSHRARTPIVGLTGRAMAEQKDQCLQAGMDFVLTKPFHFKQLREVLERWTVRA